MLQVQLWVLSFAIGQSRPLPKTASLFGSSGCLRMASSHHPSSRSNSEDEAAVVAKDVFPFVHPSIATILVAPSIYNDTQPISEDTRFQIYGSEIVDTNNSDDNDDDDHHDDPGEKSSMNLQRDLVPLAKACDTFVYGENGFGANLFDDHINDLPQLLFLLATTTGSNRRSSHDDDDDDSATTTIALLLTLNALESAIRAHVVVNGVSSAGGAPLLKTMLGQLQESDDAKTTDKKVPKVVVQVLRCVLLPTGLNLRNLLWHGFVGCRDDQEVVLRPWLALALLLLRQLEQGGNGNLRTLPSSSLEYSKKVDDPLLEQCPHLSHLKVMRWSAVQAKGERLRQQLRQSTNENCVPPLLLPDSHLSLWRFCASQIRSQKQSPTLVAVVLTALLEHVLRLRWCQANHRPEDTVARPNHFYVTLDGHGQRHKHDIVLHPYLSTTTREESPTKNLLVDVLGAHTMAYLTDLFVSGSGGPNLRAALAHGKFDGFIEAELYAMARSDLGTEQERDGPHVNWPLVDVLLLALYQVGARENPESSLQSHSTQISFLPLNYRPFFSFTAQTSDALWQVQQELDKLASMEEQDIPDQSYNDQKVCPIRASFSTVRDAIETVQSRLPGYRVGPDPIPPTESRTTSINETITHNVWTEHDANVALESIRVTRTLLRDVANATRQWTTRLDDVSATLLLYSTHSTTDASVEASPVSPTATRKRHSGRRHRQARALWARRRYVEDVYAWAAMVAVRHLNHVLLSRHNKKNNSKADNGDNSHNYNIDDAQLTQTEWIQVTQRTRMMVSTVSTFVHGNADRAYKAVDQYVKAKTVQALLYRESAERQ